MLRTSTGAKAEDRAHRRGWADVVALLQNPQEASAILVQLAREYGASDDTQCREAENVVCDPAESGAGYQDDSTDTRSEPSGFSTATYMDLSSLSIAADDGDTEQGRSSVHTDGEGIQGPSALNGGDDETEQGTSSILAHAGSIQQGFPSVLTADSDHTERRPSPAAVVGGVRTLLSALVTASTSMETGLLPTAVDRDVEREALILDAPSEDGSGINSEPSEMAGSCDMEPNPSAVICHEGSEHSPLDRDAESNHSPQVSDAETEHSSLSGDECGGQPEPFSVGAECCAQAAPSATTARDTDVMKTGSLYPKLTDTMFKLDGVYLYTPEDATAAQNWSLKQELNNKVTTMVYAILNRNSQYCDWNNSPETCTWEKNHKTTFQSVLGILVKAAAEGRLKQVETLVAFGADLTSRSTSPGEEGLQTLHLACWGGHAQVVKKLLELGIDPRAVAQGREGVHWAAFGGHVPVLRVLKDYGCDITVASVPDMSTPLHLAADNGNLEAVRWLVQNGALIHVINRDGFSPLQMAKAARVKAVVEFLDRKGSEEQFLRAAACGMVDSVKKLIEEGVNVNAGSTLKGQEGWRALHLAARRGHKKLLEVLLQAGVFPRYKTAKVLENPSSVTTVLENPSSVTTALENPSSVTTALENPSSVTTALENPSSVTTQRWRTPAASPQRWRTPAASPQCWRTPAASPQCWRTPASSPQRLENPRSVTTGWRTPAASPTALENPSSVTTALENPPQRHHSAGEPQPAHTTARRTPAKSPQCGEPQQRHHSAENPSSVTTALENPSSVTTNTGEPQQRHHSTGNPPQRHHQCWRTPAASTTVLEIPQQRHHSAGEPQQLTTALENPQGVTPPVGGEPQQRHHSPENSSSVTTALENPSASPQNAGKTPQRPPQAGETPAASPQCWRTPERHHSAGEPQQRHHSAGEPQ
nr:uncharacterized protein LOC128684674 [Cherax quadricarinatus]